jgi:hypothetical protein
MYKFNIESIHNKKFVTGKDENIVGNDKIVGGSGRQFKVYRASDINGLFGVLSDTNYKPSIQAFTDELSIDQLCDYYFSYIIYDTFDKETFKSHFFVTALQSSIEKKLLQIQDIRKIQDIQGSNESGQLIIQYDTDSISEENRSSFCQYIWALFQIQGGQQTTELPNIDFFSDDSLVLSEGQYLNHLDEIYSKYSLIMQNYKDHIDDIEEYESEYYHEDEKTNGETFVKIYNETKDKIIKANQDYVNEKEIPDEKYIVLHLLFLHKTYIDPQGQSGEKGKHKSYLLIIDEKYAGLDLIKEQNLFYNTNKMFIRNKDQFLKSIQLKIKQEDTFNKLSVHNGIEKLLNIYYAYIPHESTKDDKAIHEVFYELSNKISEFFIKNKNIYNLLVFNDSIFFKMIKDDLILTLYDLEKQFEHKFGFVRENGDNILFHIEQDYTIDTEYIKQMMLYRYKQLEQKIRSMYLEKYDVSNKKVGYSLIKYLAPQFYEIINKRKKTLNLGFALWSYKQSRYITRMINVIDFYRIGRLVEYLVLPDNTSREGVESASDRYIGVITKITGLTYNMKRLSQIQLSQIPLSISDGDNSIGIDSIRETEYILCDKVIASANTKQNTAWTSSCDSEDVKIKYRDIDLFDPINDIEIYTILPDDIKLDLTETPKCLVLRSTIIVDHKHRQKKTMQFAQHGSIAQYDTYSEDFEETIDLDTETYVSIYTIGDEKTLTLSDCFSVCNRRLRQIEDMIDDTMKIYADGKQFCFLIEKVSNEKIVKSSYPCDTLFFIEEYRKKAILDFNT